MHHLIQAYRRLVSLPLARFYILFDFYLPSPATYQRETRALDSETFSIAGIHRITHEKKDLL